MKFSILTFCLLLSNFIGFVFCECTLSSDIPQADVILQKYGRNKHIVESLDNFELITIPDGEYIEIYCDNEFSGSYINFHPDYSNEYDNRETFNNVKIIELHCKNENFEYVFDGKTLTHVENIICKNSFASLYPSTIPHCKKNGFLYGMNIRNQPIVFAEFCYDIRMSDVIFAHYVAGITSPILEDQKQFNLSNIGINFNSLNKFTFLRKRKTNENNRNRLPYYNNIPFLSIAGMTEFQVDNLIILKSYSKIFEKFLKDKIEPNSVIWWSVLKNGNWKSFEILFEKQTAENEYEVFAGKSGVVTYPGSELCDVTNELVLQVNGNKKSVPLYIWHYLKPRNNNKSNDEEVVVIGVNSPFFEIFSSEKQDNINSTMICKDMCDDINWLKPLRKTRKMAAFGYIFCCKPDEVRNVLDGFPYLNHVTPEEEITINKNKLVPISTKTLFSEEDRIYNNDGIESQV